MWTSEKVEPEMSHNKWGRLWKTIFSITQLFSLSSTFSFCSFPSIYFCAFIVVGFAYGIVGLDNLVFVVLVSFVVVVLVISSGGVFWLWFVLISFLFEYFSFGHTIFLLFWKWWKVGVWKHKKKKEKIYTKKSPLYCCELCSLFCFFVWHFRCEFYWRVAEISKNCCVIKEKEC